MKIRFKFRDIEWLIQTAFVIRSLVLIELHFLKGINDEDNAKKVMKMHGFRTEIIEKNCCKIC